MDDSSENPSLQTDRHPFRFSENEFLREAGRRLHRGQHTSDQ